MKEANCETETLYNVIECRNLEEKEAATTGDKKTMLQVIGGWYKDGFRFLESFELAKMHYGVFTKDVDVAMSTAPTAEPTKRPPLSEWPQYILEINRPRLIDQQYTIGRIWNIAGYVIDWHGCDGDKQITESINELFELVSAVQDVLTNAGIAISVHGQGLNHHVTRRAFVEQIAEIICEQAKLIGQDSATTDQEASDLTPIAPNMISGINKAYAQIERQRKDIYRLTMNKSVLENCICQIHDSSLLRGKYMNDEQFRTHANKLTTEALAKLGPRDESKLALDHQPDNSQLAAIPIMEQVQIDYEELKSLREANKRQGAIIDNLLQTNSELKAKADSLVEHDDSKAHVDRLIDEKADLRSMLKQIVAHSLKAEMDDEQFRKFARDNANHILEKTKPKKG